MLKAVIVCDKYSSALAYKEGDLMLNGCTCSCKRNQVQVVLQPLQATFRSVSELSLPKKLLFSSGWHVGAKMNTLLYDVFIDTLCRIKKRKSLKKRI